MKKLLLLLVTLTLGLMVGYSYDDSAILDKIAEMEKEHDEMEKEHDEMQAQIDAQQTGNKIYYTTSDGKKLFPNTTEPATFGAILVSNTYEEGQGVLTFDDTITSIGKEAFRDCTSLTSITIPDGVTSIGEYAFKGCTGELIINSKIVETDYSYYNYPSYNGWLKGAKFSKLTIGNGLTSIGEYAFSNCSSLTSVTIGNGVTKIGRYAFRECSSLTSVTIPDSVTSIGNWAFDDCTSLKDTYVNITDLAAYATSNTMHEIGSSNIHLLIDGKELTELVIPESVIEIGNYAFSGCSSLTSVTIGNGVTSIGSSAFQGCTSLTSITIPDSVTWIGEEAFYGCTGELTVNCNIPNGYHSNHTAYGAFIHSKFTKVTIGNGVTEIGDYAFYGCSSLTNITIPNSVTEIGELAFALCSSLTSITIPDSVTEIREQAFSCCSSLTSITIPDSVVSIGEQAFSYCRSLKSFYGKFASDDNRCLIVDGILKSFAPAELTAYTIPDSVTEIGDSAFQGCSSLTNITIPDSVTSIGIYAFYLCSSLTSVTIPDSVTEIGSDAFEDCTSLTSVTIGNSVTSIGEQAFSGCPSLTSVYCKPTTPPSGNAWMFDNNASGRKIYVPTESVEAYKTAMYWRGYAADIVGYNF